MTFIGKPNLSEQQGKKRSFLSWDRFITREKTEPVATPVVESTSDFQPVQLNIMATATCTQACKTCYAHSPEVKNNYLSQTAGKEMDLDTFRFVLGQLPTVQTILFSGWGEPLLNSQIFEMVSLAFKSHTAESIIVTNGLLIENRLEAMLASPLKRLVVSINGHTPDAFASMTGMPPDHFNLIKENVQKLVFEKKRNPKNQLEVYLSFIIDAQNYVKMPEMLRFAQDLRVDGVHFENYLSPEPGVPSARTLYTDNVDVTRFFDRLRPNFLTLNVTLPKLLDRDMSHHRNCKDVYTTLTVDGDCNVTACSMQWLFNGKMGKLWEEAFWKNNMFEWLRSVHGGLEHEVPKPCQTCPNNCGVPTYDVSFS
jgi:MoaA/NifB/PqqE/SkfB family radical SAM enzyme